jgi:mannose-6-phosphate isomerase
VLTKLTNQALPYAWGSINLISDHFGIDSTGEPMAEIWFGTHAGSATSTESGESLAAIIGTGKLPFLLKILAAGKPLSIQAHPNADQARQGFAAENAAGIPIDAAHRNYKDALAKPELIVALGRTFEALAGFKTPSDIANMFEAIAAATGSDSLAEVLREFAAEVLGAGGLEKIFLATLTDARLSQGALEEFVLAAARLSDIAPMVALLSQHNAGDRGILTALMLNHIELQTGEAIFVPAGMPHAYLSGLGVEVMLASDNVLRGGLTPKHIDIDELQKVLVFEANQPALQTGRALAQGIAQFELDVDEFAFYRISPSAANLLADANLPGDSIALCTSGEVAISTSLGESVVLAKGEAAYISGEPKTFSVAGAGEIFMAVSLS